MSIEDGKDCRNFLHNKERHMRIKEKKRLLRFKLRLYENALHREQKAYAALLEGQERRLKSYNPKYLTREELDAAYVLGNMSDEEYMSERSKIWQVFSDRGHIANIEWLQAETDQARQNYEMIIEWMERKRQDSHDRAFKKYYGRIKHNNRRRKKWRRDKLERRKELWRKHGIG